MKIDINKTTSEYISLGGDTRISINKRTGINSYGTYTYPVHSISYSSCTSSHISTDAYNYVESYLSNLRQNVDFINNRTLVNEFEEMRDDLRKIYDLHNLINIVFGSSGTDLELVSLSVSLAKNKKIHNIYICGNEVGSGTKNIANGKYFSDLTPIGHQVKTGDSIDGFSSNEISIAQIDVRKENGERLSDEEIVLGIEKEILFAIKNNRRALIHLVHRTKTGLIIPSWSKLEKILKKYEANTDVIIDACQGRISIKYVNKYLDANAMVLITGSKFFSGPPFSGALFLPENLSQRLKNSRNLPKGLGEFFTRSEFPQDWDTFNDLLPQSHNLGLILRWKAALFEMNKIFNLENFYIYKVINCFRKVVTAIIDKSKVMELDTTNLIYNEEYEKRVANSPFEIDSIITVYLKDFNQEPLTFEDSLKINKLLYSDLSTNNEQYYFLKSIINLGQPVKIMKNEKGWVGTLRIALSSNTIYSLALLSEIEIEKQFKSDMLLINQKLEYVIQNLNKLQPYV